MGVRRGPSRASSLVAGRQRGERRVGCQDAGGRGTRRRHDSRDRVARSAGSQTSLDPAIRGLGDSAAPAGQPTSLGVAPRPGSGARARTQAATRAGHAVAGSSTHRGLARLGERRLLGGRCRPDYPSQPSVGSGAGQGSGRLTAGPKYHNGRAKKPTGKAKRRTARAKRAEKAKQPTARAKRRTARAKKATARVRKSTARAKRPKARAKKRPGKAKEARAAAKLKKVMARAKKPTGKAESADLPRKLPGQARLHLPSLG